MLVIRLGALGDVVRTLPAVRGLRRALPGADLCWLVERRAAGVLAGQDFIDEVRIFPREEWTALLRGLRWGKLAVAVFRFAAQIRAEGFDWVVDFHGILKSGLISRATGAPLRVGFGRGTAREGAWLFANRRVDLPAHRISRFARNAALVRALGVRVDPGEDLLWAAGPPTEVDRWLEAHPLPILLHPGSSPGTPYKRLPTETYGRVASGLREAGGFEVVVLRGAGRLEGRLAREVVAASKGAARLAPETATFRELAALLSGARLFVGSDSGPLHAAALAGTRVVQLLGPTDPIENQPHAGSVSRSLRLGLACSPCRSGCAEAPCMTGFESRQIVDACVELLEREAAGEKNPAMRR
ncbi:MAG: glycosyltransferase family 9 protein [Myxococcota bacterium]